MKAITTKYHGPTNTRGARISATAGDNRISVPYDYEGSGVEPYAKAALALARKLNWTGRLIAGATKDGYVFVFANSDAFDI